MVFIEVELGRGLRRLDRPLLVALEGAHDEASERLTEAYRDNVPRASGAFAEAIKKANALYTETGARIIDIESDQYRSRLLAARRPEGIGDLIERGFRRRGKRVTKVPGQYPAKQAVDDTTSDVNSILGAHVKSAIRIIELT